MFVQVKEDIVSRRVMKRGGWELNSSTCHVHIHHRVSYMYMEKVEFIGQLTIYVGRGDGVHCIIEGYEETRIGN